MVNDDIRTSAPYPASEKTVPWELFTMAWIVLVISGLFEAVWATALGKSDGFSKMSPTVVFILGLIVSMAGLAYAMRTLPIGTAYAVWVGIGRRPDRRIRDDHRC